MQTIISSGKSNDLNILLQSLIIMNQQPHIKMSVKLPCAPHDEDSKSALTISETDASAIAKGVRKPALYSALAREPYKY